MNVASSKKILDDEKMSSVEAPIGNMSGSIQITVLNSLPKKDAATGINKRPIPDVDKKLIHVSSGTNEDDLKLASLRAKVNTKK